MSYLCSRGPWMMKWKVLKAKLLYWWSFGYTVLVAKKKSNRSSTPSFHRKHQVLERNRRRQTKLVLAHATSGNRITSATDTVAEVIQVPWCCFQNQAVKKKRGSTELTRLSSKTFFSEGSEGKATREALAPCACPSQASVQETLSQDQKKKSS